MNGILIPFQIAVIVHFWKNCKVITGFFFIWIFTERGQRVERCEEDGLSSFLAFPSSWNESVLKDRLDAGGTTPVEHILFPTVRNHSVPHQLRRYCYSTRVSLNCSDVKNFSESSQYSKPVMLPP